MNKKIRALLENLALENCGYYIIFNWLLYVLKFTYCKQKSLNFEKKVFCSSLSILEKHDLIFFFLQYFELSFGKMVKMKFVDLFKTDNFVP